MTDFKRRCCRNYYGNQRTYAFLVKEKCVTSGIVYGLAVTFALASILSLLLLWLTL